MRIFFILCAVFALCGLNCKPADASFLTNGEKRIGTELMNVQLIDEFGKTFQLSDLRGQAFFIHPMFASCKSTCPMMTQNLVQSFKNLNYPDTAYKIVSLSFDPKEKPESLQEFRKTHKLPQNWNLAFGEESQIRSLMDFLDFRYVKTGSDDFAHSNLLVLVDNNLIIQDYLYGVSISSSDLGTALGSMGDAKRTSNTPWFLLLSGMIIIAILLTLLIARIPQNLWQNKLRQSPRSEDKMNT